MTNVLNNHPDHEIITLAVALAQEMARHRTESASWPEILNGAAEHDKIIAMIKPAEDIANRLQGMVAVTPEGEHFRSLGEIFLNA